ncbi:hypothetical protein KIK84_08605 [Curvibacter sp. CHRR-16]|uniref:hypothetical protein n=1 Tax=Curvibacter sp. CHRR-16 TaxID=2835872 RepID=UPI001BDB6566|nr:hypothetical protein [Curvibacter sp. CHRR-16]MBT0570386.1 hypothetical protein [Curvibacter sp. CHRR-16]
MGSNGRGERQRGQAKGGLVELERSGYVCGVEDGVAELDGMEGKHTNTALRDINDLLVRGVLVWLEGAGQ